MSGVEICPKCLSAKIWRWCTSCEDGFSGHDCGEDSCCCVSPELNVSCSRCEGNEGWFQCFVCTPWEEDD